MLGILGNSRRKKVRIVVRVLITVRRSPAQKYLVNLYTKALIREVRDLINQRKHSQAITTIFAKGIFERKVREEELRTIKADLMLSETTANWDLT